MSVRHTEKSFILTARNKHGNKFDYSCVRYINNSTKIIIICPIHGKCIQTPMSHLRSITGCNACGLERQLAARRLSLTEFIGRANVIHGNKYDYSVTEYSQNNTTKVSIICPEHGKFTQTPKEHLKGSGCTECSKLSSRAKQAHSFDVFHAQAQLIHNQKYNYSNVKYINALTKVELICYKHGSFWQKPNSHLNGHGCKQCTHYVSKPCIAWLDHLNLPNDHVHREVRVKVSNRRFIVDGFDPQTNTVYEFLGDYWHGNPKIYKPRAKNQVNKKTFGQLYKGWLEKEKLLTEAGYKVISVWESNFTSI